jgi:hypothetical protein
MRRRAVIIVIVAIAAVASFAATYAIEFIITPSAILPASFSILSPEEPKRIGMFSFLSTSLGKS